MNTRDVPCSCYKGEIRFNPRGHVAADNGSSGAYYREILDFHVNVITNIEIADGRLFHVNDGTRLVSIPAVQSGGWNEPRILHEGILEKPVATFVPAADASLQLWKSAAC